MCVCAVCGVSSGELKVEQNKRPEIWKRLRIRRSTVERRTLSSLYIACFLYKTKLHVRTSAEVHTNGLVRAYPHTFIVSRNVPVCMCTAHRVQESGTLLTRTTHTSEHERVQADGSRPVCVDGVMIDFIHRRGGKNAQSCIGLRIIWNLVTEKRSKSTSTVRLQVSFMCFAFGSMYVLLLRNCSHLF